MKKILLIAFMTALLSGAGATFSGLAMAQGPDTSAVKKKLTAPVDIVALTKFMLIPDDTMIVAVIKTKLGNIEIELYSNDAPKTTANFAGLARAGFFDNIIFHRIAKKFVIQGGDPTGTGEGGESIYGREFEDELNKETQSYRDGYLRGTVAMANCGPNTNTSQFFITLTDALHLPKNYSIFGRVIAGMQVVDKIAEGAITPMLSPSDGTPKDPVSMEKVIIEKRKREVHSVFEVR
jgi:peptidyl-prolyl cis-trans isomerase-like 1